ncbi:MAG: hypothetical protein RL726_1925, partial [Actinomycetota bacterium]
VLGLDNRRSTGRFDPRVPPEGVHARILDLFDAEPLSLDDVATRARDALDASFGATAVSLGHLEATGWLICTGGWFERAHV